jgi:hypothetical protein
MTASNKPQRRRRFSHTVSFEERLADFSRHTREQAKGLPAGKERDELLRKARQTDTVSQISNWMKPALKMTD